MPKASREYYQSLPAKIGPGVLTGECRQEYLVAINIRKEGERKKGVLLTLVLLF